MAEADDVVRVDLDAAQPERLGELERACSRSDHPRRVAARTRRLGQRKDASAAPSGVAPSSKIRSASSTASSADPERASTAASCARASSPSSRSSPATSTALRRSSVDWWTLGRRRRPRGGLHAARRRPRGRGSGRPPRAARPRGGATRPGPGGARSATLRSGRPRGRRASPRRAVELGAVELGNRLVGDLADEPVVEAELASAEERALGLLVDEAARPETPERGAAPSPSATAATAPSQKT